MSLRPSLLPSFLPSFLPSSEVFTLRIWRSKLRKSALYYATTPTNIKLRFSLISRYAFSHKCRSMFLREPGHGTRALIGQLLALSPILHCDWFPASLPASVGLRKSLFDRGHSHRFTLFFGLPLVVINEQHDLQVCL